jgi:hypothetical protein
VTLLKSSSPSLQTGSSIGSITVRLCARWIKGLLREERDDLPELDARTVLHSVVLQAAVLEGLADRIAVPIDERGGFRHAEQVIRSRYERGGEFVGASLEGCSGALGGECAQVSGASAPDVGQGFKRWDHLRVFIYVPVMG